MDNLSPYFSNDDYGQLTRHIQDRLDQLEQLPHPQVKDAMLDLLGSMDMMHREAFVRMLLIAQGEAPELLTRFQDDPIIHSVLSLYEFIPTEADQPEASPNAPHVTFIPMDQIGVSPALKQPIWMPGGRATDIPAGTFKAQRFEDVEVLVCNVAGELFALRNACLDSILPLSSGQLEGHILICPWHNCRYDVRNGEIQNGSGLQLESYPIEVDDRGAFAVGFNIPHYGAR